MEILSGAACGLFMGTVFIIVWALAVTSPSRGSLKGPSLLTTPPCSMYISILFPLAVTIFWGFVGGVLGLLYLAARELFPGDGVGSPNQAFTIAVCLLTINILVLGALWFRKKAWWSGYGVGLTFAGIFGWLMPWLAN